jgi:hypothetical protein
MKYIFIIAQDGDSVADDVCQWIRCLDNLKIFRINETDKITLLNIYISSDEKESFELQINNEEKINSLEIAAFW